MRTYLRACVPLAAFSVVLAACGGAASPGEGEAGAGGTSEAEAPDEVVELAMNPTDDRNEQLYEAAQGNGSILLYVTLPPPEVDAQIEGFNELYPDIEVDYYRGGSTGSVINRVLTESAAGQLNADVSWNNDHIAYVLDSQGLFLDFVTAEGDAYDPDFQVVESSYPSYINYWMFAYNTNMVEEDELPQTYDELLEERWAGDLTVATYSDWFYGLWEILGEDRAEAFFSELGAHDPLLAPQFTPALLPVIQGERSLTISTVSGVLRGQQDDGAPLEGYFPEDATVARTVPISVFAEGGNPEGGLLFAEYVLSQEGQQLLADRGRVPGHEGVDPDPLELRPESAQLIDYASFVPEEAEWEEQMSESLGSGGE